MLALCSLLLACIAQPEGARVEPETQPHVVIIHGEGEYRSEITMPALGERLESTWGWRVTVLADQQLHAGDGNHVPGLGALADADLVVLYLRFRQWPASDLTALQQYIDSGRPLAAFRTTTHAFRYDPDDPRAAWNNFGRDALGAPWLYHYGHDASTEAHVVSDSPIVDGVEPQFNVRSWTYHVRPDYPPQSAHVLVEGSPVRDGVTDEDPEKRNPVAWTCRTSAGGRVFMTTMGHPEDFRMRAFRRLLGNGLHWALDLEIPPDTLPNFPEAVHPDDLGAAAEPSP